MNKLFLLLLFIFPTLVSATQIQYGTTYAPNGQVTNTNLNGNFNNISNVVNGNIDNTNVNTTSGYRLYQTVAVLPSAGNQGAVYFLTSDNSLNFDNGSSFTKSVSVASPSTNSVPYYNGSSWIAQPIATVPGLTPIGGIILWSGSVVSIPANWHLCDGTNGTPNLENLFVIGAGGTYAVGATGGSTTISQTNLPATGLTMSVQTYGGGINNGGSWNVTGNTNNGSTGFQSIGTTGNMGSGTAYLQPYYSLAYIQRIS